mgnify:CR=1 FL=1
MRYELYTNKDLNYSTATMSNEYKILTYDTARNEFRLIKQSLTRYDAKPFNVSKERTQEFIKKVARNILCTLQ